MAGKSLLILKCDSPTVLMKSARYGSYISRNFETPGSPNKVYVGNVVRHSDDLSDDMCVWQRNECCDS